MTISNAKKESGYLKAKLEDIEKRLDPIENKVDSLFWKTMTVSSTVAIIIFIVTKNITN